MNEWMNVSSADSCINLDHKHLFQCLEQCPLVPHAHIAEESSVSLEVNPSAFELWKKSRCFLSQVSPVPYGKVSSGASFLLCL